MYYNELKEIYDNVSLTYGYKTKAIRIENNLPKEHRIDALCISGNPNKKICDTYYYLKKIRNHNRQIHKMTIPKGGKRKLNQSPFVVKRFHLFDRVLFNGKECFITGRRSSGYFKLITLNGTVIHNSAKVKDLKLLESRKSYIIETRQNIIRKENMAIP